jgi:hypothetical protein
VGTLIAVSADAVSRRRQLNYHARTPRRMAIDSPRRNIGPLPWNRRRPISIRWVGKADPVAQREFIHTISEFARSF